MPSGYSRSPKLLKGAFVKLAEEFVGPVPNVVVFQYNPEKMTRSLAGLKTAGTGEDALSKSSNPLAQPFDPRETFDLALELDATDALEEPLTHPVAMVAGVADRIAAIEMLLYPPSEKGVIAQVSKKVASFVGGSGDVLPRVAVPVVLFIWGPGRVLPVRLTDFKVEEQAFSTTLYPIRATVTVSLKVVTRADFADLKRELTASEEFAMKAYEFTRNQKEALALANALNTLESVPGQIEGLIGLLPL